MKNLQRNTYALYKKLFNNGYWFRKLFNELKIIYANISPLRNWSVAVIKKISIKISYLFNQTYLTLIKIMKINMY